MARDRRYWWAIGVGALAILLVGVLVGYLAFPPHGLRLPATIKGAPRLTGARWDSVAGQMIGNAGTRGQENVAGVYGTGGQPRFAFLATDAESPASSDVASIALLAQYLEFSLNRTLSVDLSATTTVRRGGVTYQCSPMAVASVTGFACAWNDAGTTGYVLSFTPSGNATDLAAAVRAAAVR